LGKAYHTGAGLVHALRDINVTIHAGEFVAIMGPSGSGKSTFMNLLGCLDPATSGSYRLTGKEVAGLSGDQLAEIRNRHIGFVFQQFNLLGRVTALENVALPLLYAGLSRGERMARAREILVRVGLGERLGHTPGQLSGGQQQRVAIARALVNKPSVLLADEPTGALDSTTAMEVMELLVELNRGGQTLVFVTHDAGVASRARRVITFRDGELVSDCA
jgi:ABC-type lipoprotein export system ATPase subunit